MDVIDRQEAIESFCDMRDGVPKVYGDEMYSDKDIVNTIKSLNKVNAVPLSVIDEIKADIIEMRKRDPLYYYVSTEDILDWVLNTIDRKVKEYET